MSQSKYKDIIVSRYGLSYNSFMITKYIIKEINPRFLYYFKNKALIKTNYLSSNYTNKITKNIKINLEPNYETVYGNWNTSNKLHYNNENILGNSCVFESYYSHYNIPIEIATQKKLDYYNCILITNETLIKFDSEHTLPLTKMSIGKRYFKDYILNKKYGNGFYLEYHDRPHFHQPINSNSKGFIILAKRIGQIEYHLTGFIIPLETALYIPPFVIHNDCCLIGDYNVVYSKTSNYSTANFYNNNNLVKFTFS